ncbi:MAG: GIY-YIG nuclease family protein [Oligoflexales bacterium]|nr:GIY-YIG nuclease family protein [Oligoflexales bacterium]
MKVGYVYLLANISNTVVYTGFTTNLRRRLWEHKTGIFDGFTKKYNVTKLVYYETIGSIRDGIAREKMIKDGSRLKKEALIYSMNPDWKDLSNDL